MYKLAEFLGPSEVEKWISIAFIHFVFSHQIFCPARFCRLWCPRVSKQETVLHHARCTESLVSTASKRAQPLECEMPKLSLHTRIHHIKLFNRVGCQLQAPCHNFFNSNERRRGFSCFPPRASLGTRDIIHLTVMFIHGKPFISAWIACNNLYKKKLSFCILDKKKFFYSHGLMCVYTLIIPRHVFVSTFRDNQKTGACVHVLVLHLILKLVHN